MYDLVFIFFFCLLLVPQVQFQEETLEEDKAWPVSLPLLTSSASPAATCQDLCWVGIREGGSVRWINSLFVQILWIWLCLTIKNV